MNVVVFGASGYVGGRLIPELLQRGHTVRAVTRTAASVQDNPWSDQVEIVTADLMDPTTLDAVLESMDAAFYLVHSMGRPDFEEIDRTAAENMVNAAARSDLRQIVYLGGLGAGDLSPHLASRQEVGRILASGTVPVTEFRAAVIIGSGSLSFEMTRYLTEVLPVMVTPKWVRTLCQPIAIRDVLYYLAESLEVDEAAGEIIEIGGADVITYEDMMRGYARVAGLKRRTIVRLPVLSLGLSARWVGLVTPLPRGIASHLIDSLRHEVVADTDLVERIMPHDPVDYETAVARALKRTRGDDVPTRWARGSWAPSDPLPSDPEHAFGTIFKDTQRYDTEADPSDVAWAFMRVGGSQGYYAADWAWKVRGWVDKLFGGAGLRRGRRDTERVSVGEPLDFWRVVDVEPDRSLELKAEMRVPGEAWLGWKVDPRPDGGSTLVQTAWFVPRGLFGRLYWWILVPFHKIIFPQMAAGIIDAAENRKEPART